MKRFGIAVITALLTVSVVAASSVPVVPTTVTRHVTSSEVVPLTSTSTYLTTETTVSNSTTTLRETTVSTGLDGRTTIRPLEHESFGALLFRRGESLSVTFTTSDKVDFYVFLPPEFSKWSNSICKCVGDPLYSRRGVTQGTYQYTHTRDTQIQLDVVLYDPNIGIPGLIGKTVDIESFRSAAVRLRPEERRVTETVAVTTSSIVTGTRTVTETTTITEQITVPLIDYFLRPVS